MGSTQSTVSKAVAQLEHDCGTRLMQRLSRGIRLTEAGEIVCRRALGMLGEQENMITELASLRGMLRGSLRLGLPVLASGALFGPKVAAFRKEFPQVRLHLSEHRTSRLEEDVRTGAIEVGATLLPVPRDFAWKLVHVDTIMAVLPRTHSRARSRELTLRDLADDPVVLLEEGFALHSLVRTAYRRRRLRLQVSGTTANVDFSLAMVAAGLGIAFLPRILLGSRPQPSLRLVPMAGDDIEWRLAAIWRKDEPLSPPAARWIERLDTAGEPGRGTG